MKLGVALSPTTLPALSSPLGDRADQLHSFWKHGLKRGAGLLVFSRLILIGKEGSLFLHQCCLEAPLHACPKSVVPPWSCHRGSHPVPDSPTLLASVGLPFAGNQDPPTPLQTSNSTSQNSPPFFRAGLRLFFRKTGAWVG